MKNEKKTCFSYIRFSSLPQAQGDSERRQLEIAPRVAKEKGWILDETLNAQDLGLSGYKGSNLKTIEGIIKAAEQGSIPQGAVCIVEALDRLTRIKLDDAYQLFRRILKCGIEVYTDRTGRHTTAADLNNPMSIMMTVVELDAGFQFSEKLADRVTKGWAARRAKVREGSERMSKNCPWWINKDTWKLIPERAKIVKMIFNLYLEGNGMFKITRILNDKNIPSFGGKKWSIVYLSRLLHNRATIGEFQPCVSKSVLSKNGILRYNRFPTGESIPNYFPAVIDKETFLRVMDKLGNQKKAPRTEQVKNLFSGIAFCECGSKMYQRINGSGDKYYVCWSRVKGGGGSCKHSAMPYGILERILGSFVFVHPMALTRKTDTEAEIELSTLRGRAIEIETQIARITELCVNGAGTKALVAKQSTLETEQEEVNKSIELRNGKTMNGKHEEITFKKLLANLDKLGTDIELRRDVREWLLSHMDLIEFNTTKRTVSYKFKNSKETDTLNFDKEWAPIFPKIEDMK